MKTNFDMDWNETKDYVLREYGNYNGDPDDDPCFFCPHCMEPLYQADFPYFKMDFKGRPICPICEEVF